MSLLKMAVKLGFNAADYYKGLDDVQNKSQKVALTLNNTFGRMFTARYAMKFAKEVTDAINQIPENIDKEFAQGKKPSIGRQQQAASIRSTIDGSSVTVGQEHAEGVAAGAKVLGQVVIGGLRLIGTGVVQGLAKMIGVKTNVHEQAENQFGTWWGSSRMDVRHDEADKQSRLLKMFQEQKKEAKEKADHAEREAKSSRTLADAMRKTRIESMTPGAQVAFHLARRHSLLGINSGGAEGQRLKIEAEKEMQSAIGGLGSWKTANELGIRTSRKLSPGERVNSILRDKSSVDLLERIAKATEDQAKQTGDKQITLE